MLLHFVAGICRRMCGCVAHLDHDHVSLVMTIHFDPRPALSPTRHKITLLAQLKRNDVKVNI